MGGKAPRKRLACRVMGVPHGCLARTRTSLGAPPTPRLGVSEARLQTPGAENAPRERDGLFDIVSWDDGGWFSVRSSPRGAPRDSRSAFTRVCDALCVAGTPLRGPMITA